MRKLFFLLTLFLISISGKAQNATFKAAAPNAVVVGQQFRLTYSSNQQGKDLRVSELSDFDVLMGPVISTSSSTEITNGQARTESTYAFVYTLMASKEGTFTIPPASIKIGNSEYKSNAVTIRVLPQDKTTGSSSGGGGGTGDQGASSSGSSNIGANDLFVRMIVSKNSVYENEGFLVTFKLYSLLDVGVENAKFPEYEGFIAQEIEQANPQWTLENYNGRNYRTVVLKQTILYPQHSGKITIGSGKFDFQVKVRSQQRVRSIFDDFFESYINVKKVLNSSPATIDVKALPAGKPASFSGAVGDYTMTSTINTSNLKSNDPVTIKVVISGNGNIKLAKNPEIIFPNDFEVYDPKVDVNQKVSQGGVSGSKSIEYYAIPRYAGEFTIPKAEFSYFDLKSGTYKTLSTNEYNLHVAQGEAGSGGNQPIMSNSANKEDVRFVGKDIRYIQTNGFTFYQGNFFFGTIGYWLFYLITGALFIVFFIIYRKQAAENANIALVRTKKANKIASKRLKTAGKFLKENQKEAFYDEVLKAIWGYLSDKLNIPVSSLTKDNVETELVRYGVGDALIKEFHDILNTCEFARFAPTQGTGAMDELYHSAVRAIDQMENTIKK